MSYEGQYKSIKKVARHMLLDAGIVVSFDEETLVDIGWMSEAIPTATPEGEKLLDLLVP